jgi:hypothetical protein
MKSMRRHSSDNTAIQTSQINNISERKKAISPTPPTVRDTGGKTAAQRDVEYKAAYQQEKEKQQKKIVFYSLNRKKKTVASRSRQRK